jgi:carbamoyl-phosphate synthase large subunit
MPKRTDIKKILIIGSGPIVIGQAAEFDYSGTQACKALMEEGYEVVLVNSNPATIMTDPQMATKVYLEPLSVQILAQIIEKEKPDAILPTLGGQTALNLATELAEKGVLKREGVQLIGADVFAIKKAEDRMLFKESMKKIGIPVLKSGIAHSVEEAKKVIEDIGLPVVIRPSFTLGGWGGGMAYNIEEFHEIVHRALSASPIKKILIEESVFGWKEFELEVMRDLADNVIIICSIENFDAMGVHTGESITVAPAQTLTDREYQTMRDWAIKIIREIGVETGGSNIQFAVRPEDGRMVAIEINPRVSRSSALASKATGFPIAKIAAKLAVGYTLDELPNDITRETPASFEPTLDYVVVKVPRWHFEKFKDADQTLGTQMKSVGEVMAIGRTFKEALQKALRSLEFEKRFLPPSTDPSFIHQMLATPNKDRIFYIKEALSLGMSVEEVSSLTKVDPWFLQKIKEIVQMEERVKECGFDAIRDAKRIGVSDERIAELLGKSEEQIREERKKRGILPVYKMVDTCAAEFEAYTPYLYSTYEAEDEAPPTNRRKVVILGAGPNRIGQGIEFDYCCCHAVFALQEEGYEVIMINSNPETVSTDYDTADRLYFEPLTYEEVLNIVEREKPSGVILQFGGQTPLKLALALERAGVRILGTSPNSIDIAEDRKRFSRLLKRLGILQAPFGWAHSSEEAKRCASSIGYPVLVRPSYVLGGRAMEIVYDEEGLLRYMMEAVAVSPDHPVLIDKFLEDAIEVDVDAVSDGEDVLIGGVMEHIEEAGVHSGDSACCIPPHTLSDAQISTLCDYTKKIAKALKVIGLLNIQFAVKGSNVYVLEANPRASRTIPYVSKATGVPLAKIAAKAMIGKRLHEQGYKEGMLAVKHTAVKEAVLPFAKFFGVDPILGPEMRSTGEVIGMDIDFGRAYAKSQIAAGQPLPLCGTVFISVADKDKRDILFIAKKLQDLGFKVLATKGTARMLKKNGVSAKEVYKVGEGRPNVVDYIKNKKIDLIINTPLGRRSKKDEAIIRTTAILYNIPCITTVAGAAAATNGIEAMRKRQFTIKHVKEYHAREDKACM